MPRFRIFLASAGGLDEYRTTVREQFEHVRRSIAPPLGVEVELVGWTTWRRPARRGKHSHN